MFGDKALKATAAFRIKTYFFLPQKSLPALSGTQKSPPLPPCRSRSRRKKTMIQIRGRTAICVHRLVRSHFLLS
jgi:hypothetical protein